MPILNVIHLPHTGKVGVIEWTGTSEEFVTNLKTPESAVLVKLGPRHLLISVSKDDTHLLHSAEDFHSKNPDSTSIYIRRRLSPIERDEIINVLEILIDNGSIQEFGINIRNVYSGTFLNFHHACSLDCSLVRPFVEYLTR